MLKRQLADGRAWQKEFGHSFHAALSKRPVPRCRLSGKRTSLPGLGSIEARSRLRDPLLNTINPKSAATVLCSIKNPHTRLSPPAAAVRNTSTSTRGPSTTSSERIRSFIVYNLRLQSLTHSALHTCALLSSMLPHTYAHAAFVGLQEYGSVFAGGGRVGKNGQGELLQQAGCKRVMKSVAG